MIKGPEIPTRWGTSETLGTRTHCELGTRVCSQHAEPRRFEAGGHLGLYTAVHGWVSAGGVPQPLGDGVPAAYSGTQLAMRRSHTLLGCSHHARRRLAGGAYLNLWAMASQLHTPAGTRTSRQFAAIPG